MMDKLICGMFLVATMYGTNLLATEGDVGDKLLFYVVSSIAAMMFVQKLTEVLKKEKV